MVLFLSVSLCPSEWHTLHMAAISSAKFDSLLKMSPDFYGCKSHMAAFVLTRGEHRTLVILPLEVAINYSIKLGTKFLI